MTAGGRSVRPYVAIAGLLLLGTVFALLGAWQLRRAATSQATLAQFERGDAAATLQELPRSLDEDQRFRRFEVQGEWVAEPQFLLDNQLHDGVAGYDVLTALRLPGVRERLLVDRGWVPTGPDRRVLPNVAIEGDARHVSGRLERLRRPGLRLGDRTVPGPSAGLTVVQFPTADELAERLGAPVFDYQLLLDAEAPDGYMRDWQAPGIPVERHLAYAGQWLLLAAGALAAAVVMAAKHLRRGRAT